MALLQVPSTSLLFCLALLLRQHQPWFQAVSAFTICPSADKNQRRWPCTAVSPPVFTPQSRRSGSPLVLSSSRSKSTSGTAEEKLILLDDDANELLAPWQTDLSLVELQGLLQTAETAARAAGSVIVQHKGCSSEQCSIDGEMPPSDGGDTIRAQIKTSIKDIVTQYDKQAQQAVESIVRTAYPTHSFLGEEDVDPGAAASERALLEALRDTQSGFVWICDPIDGTANFAAGLDLCAVTISVVYQGVPIVGVVYDPHKDELFAAVKGQGSMLNGDYITANDNGGAIDSIQDAIVNAGCPADADAFAVSMRGVQALSGQSRGVRMIACSALTTAWIAAGRLSGHFGYDLSSWDLVAGALLIHEAGGCITDLDGSPYRVTTRNMLCSTNAVLHKQILHVLRDAGAVQYARQSS